jgi:DNA-directed RNA polymerase subunit RPC12/RpoP
MNGYHCPRCLSLFDARDEGECRCPGCGQLVLLPRLSDPVAAVPGEEPQGFYVESDSKWIDDVFMPALILCIVGVPVVLAPLGAIAWLITGK